MSARRDVVYFGGSHGILNALLKTTVLCFISLTPHDLKFLNFIQSY